MRDDVRYSIFSYVKEMACDAERLQQSDDPEIRKQGRALEEKANVAQDKINRAK